MSYHQISVATYNLTLFVTSQGITNYVFKPVRLSYISVTSRVSGTLGICKTRSEYRNRIFIYSFFHILFTPSLQVNQKTRLLSEQPDKVMLTKLRILEKKMGIVLTLVCTHFLPLSLSLLFSFQQFKASVWAVINQQPDHSDPNDTTITS